MGSARMQTLQVQMQVYTDPGSAVNIDLMSETFVAATLLYQTYSIYQNAYLLPYHSPVNGRLFAFARPKISRKRLKRYSKNSTDWKIDPNKKCAHEEVNRCLSKLC